MSINPAHNPVHVAVEEAENALDTAVGLINEAVTVVQAAADSGATTLKATVGGVEKTADQILDQAASHASTALDGLTTLVHLTKPQ